MNVMTAAARWIRGKARLAADLPAAEGKLAEIEANPPLSDDPAEHRDWIEKRDAARRDVEALKGALAIATAEAAKAEAAQSESAADATHVAEEKASRADEKLVREIDELARKLAAKRDELNASIARTDAYNGQRGSRPFVMDAEARARTAPARTIPASYRDEVHWEDGNGNRPVTYRTDAATGELVPVEQGFVRKVVKVCQSQERQVLPQMPTRFADALVLVDMQGRKL